MAYRDTFEYKLIYVMTIPDEDHKGFSKSERRRLRRLPANLSFSQLRAAQRRSSQEN